MKIDREKTTNKKRAITLGELITRYELSNQADGKSPRTIAWYSDMLMTFSGYMKEELQCHDLSVFNTDIVRDYIIYLRNKSKFQGHPYTPQQNKPISPKTVQCHVRALKAFSSWLYAENYTIENRLTNLKLPKAPIKTIEPLTPEEIKQITASINKNLPTGLRNHAIFVTALDNGVRASEIVSIALGQLNLKEGYIKVMGKGAKERIVPIGKFVQMTLWHYISQVRPKPVDPDCDSLFLSRNGKPITANTIKLIFTRLAKSSGVERLHAHLCRHTFATRFLINGGDVFSLQQILGHSTLEMVRHYVNLASSHVAIQHQRFSPLDHLNLRKL